QYLPNVPAELESVVARMLAKDRDARYWSAQEVLTDLKRVKAGCEFASDIGATSPMDHSACYDTNIAMLSEFQTPSPISPELNPPSQAGPELNAPSQAGPELKPPSQVRFETNRTPITAQPDWHSARQMRYSGAPSTTPPQVRPQRSRLRMLLLPALVCLAILLAAPLGSLYFATRAVRIDSI